MKTILVPTDFSNAARHAAEFAASIAVAGGARLVLYHMYSLPVSTTEVPVLLSLDEIRKISIDALDELAGSLKAKHGKNLNVVYECGCGYPEDVISEYANDKSADLIVMGLRGAGIFREKLIGSTTSTLMRRCRRPVLGVGQEATFSGLKRIAFASDYHGFRKVETLRPLRDLAQLFGSKVYIVNIVKEPAKLPKISEAVEGLQIDHYLVQVEHSFHYKESEDVTAGLNSFVLDNQIDMLVMVPGDHSALQRILQEPHTKKMAFHSVVPVLALKEPQ